MEKSWLGLWTYIYAVMIFLIASGLALFVLMNSSLFFLPMGLLEVSLIGFLVAAMWWIMKRSSSLEKLVDIIEDTLVYAYVGKGKKKRGS